MHPQRDGISLIGPCWFLVLCNDGITSLRDEQRAVFFLHLATVRRRLGKPAGDQTRQRGR